MNETKIIQFDGKQTIDSRDVAGMTGTRHTDLVRRIRRYIKDMEPDAKLRPANFFIESSYLDKNNQERVCFLCTKQGCEMVANKMTGKKGTLFTARYVTLFNQYQEERKALGTHLTPEELELKRQYIQEMKKQNTNKSHELRNEDVKLFLKLGKVADEYGRDDMALEFRGEAIRQMNALPVGARREYTAMDISKIIHVSPIMIGKWGNKLGIKKDHNLAYQDRYGSWRYFPEALQIFQDNALEIQDDFADSLDDF